MTPSLFDRKKSGVSKKTKDDSFYVSKRSRAEWTQAAIDRDVERRKKEREDKGRRSPPINKRDLNLTVEERG